MTQTDFIEIAQLRICIGFLGEKQQYSWWQSDFFSQSSASFLVPVFAKTSFLSQYYGVKKAASIVHDEHIGIGKGVFHLFRLPEMHEIELHRILESAEIEKDVKIIICSKEKAVQFLQEYTGDANTKSIGPVRMGNTKDMMEKSVWERVACHYLKAFKLDNKTFPFFSENQ